MSSPNKNPIIVWFQQDLRLSDNPALALASEKKVPLILLYILPEKPPAKKIGSASQWWLRESLLSLQKSLVEKYQAKLIFARGEPLSVLEKIVNATQASSIYWNRVFEVHHLKQEKKIEQHFERLGIITQPFNGSLIKNPWDYQNSSGNHWKVFTPFWRKLRTLTMRDVYPTPKKIQTLNELPSLEIDELIPLPTIPWYQSFYEVWSPGEANATKRFQLFLKHGLHNYMDGRDRADQNVTSHLSPHLHFGELSPIQIWHTCLRLLDQKPALSTQIEKFLSELAWREFSYHLLFYHPTLPSQPFRAEFSQFPWQPDPKLVRLWQKGLTGYPIVDAGMRELWATGYMHNRIRMICASFLTKHLLQPWQRGEEWFWDTLVDADLANNSASWQWVAGSGADAAPYFRIFNPILQGNKCDPNGEYVKKWLPELSKLPVKYIHSPWQAPEALLEQAHVTLGKSYPLPIVSHDMARQRALDAYKKIKL